MLQNIIDSSICSYDYRRWATKNQGWSKSTRDGGVAAVVVGHKLHYSEIAIYSYDYGRWATKKQGWSKPARDGGVTAVVVDLKDKA